MYFWILIPATIVGAIIVYFISAGYNPFKTVGRVDELIKAKKRISGK